MCRPLVWRLRRLLGLEQKDSDVSEVEVDKMLRFYQACQYLPIKVVEP